MLIFGDYNSVESGVENLAKIPVARAACLAGSREFCLAYLGSYLGR